MKKEVKLLRQKAITSLILSIEHFNRPSDIGRVEAVLIFLDHSFEMLLKAGILHKGGQIREKGAKQTFGFDHCVRKAVSDGNIKFLESEQALLLQGINGLRDAAQHHLVDVSEPHLYLQAQAGLSVFRWVFKRLFREDLQIHLPERVLPMATTAPLDLEALFDAESREICRLLRPGSRKKIEATAKLRSLAIVEGAFCGEKVQPSDSDLRKSAQSLIEGKSWTDVFPGVATINLSVKGYGPSIDLCISKKGDTPVTLVPEGTPGAMTVAVKRVDELGFYSLGRDQIAEAVGLTKPMTTAFIRYLNLKADSECHKRIQIGKTTFERYSQKAIAAIKNALNTTNQEMVWKGHG